MSSFVCCHQSSVRDMRIKRLQFTNLSFTVAYVMQSSSRARRIN